MTTREWEPGDPVLTRRGGFGYYLFNFRDLNATEMDPTDCACPDRATWPEPMYNRRLPEDPLAKFINEYHEWKKENG